VTRSFDVGGAALHIRSAGQPLVPHLTRALAHLPPADSHAEGLTVLAWDVESTGADMPAEPWRGARNGDEAYRALVGDAYLVAEEGRIEALDLATGEAVFCVDSPRRFPWYEGAVPLQTIVQRWAATRGLGLVHAGAVGRGDGCVLIVGRSGAGKSTTALACVGSPLRYLADDFCLVRASDATVFSLYNSAKTTDDTLARLPHLASASTKPGPPEEKSVAYLHEFAPEALLQRAPLRSVVVPRITDRRTPALVAAGRATALAELAPSSLVALRREREDAFRRLVSVAAAVPCHVLELGSDLDAIPDLLARLLDD
jgi:hypothetical protein